MARLRHAYQRLPNSIRRAITVRRLRRWLRATAYIRWHNARVVRHAAAVIFYPMRPEPKMQAAWLVRALRLRIGLEPVPGQPTIAWDTGTYFADAARGRLPPDAINGRCLDVSKTCVDATWEAVAGYGIAIEPSGNRGPMVVKSEENGAHDGRLVSGPARKRRGYVYQRFIDTRHDGRIYGTRPVIIGDEMPMVLDFWCAEADLFRGASHCSVRSPSEVYTRTERDQIMEFAHRIGMEFGELEVLRDRDSGLIYVIDANRTSFRPALLSRADLRRSYRQMVPAFRRLLESRRIRRDLSSVG